MAEILVTAPRCWARLEVSAGVRVSVALCTGVPSLPPARPRTPCPSQAGLAFSQLVSETHFSDFGHSVVLLQ